MPLTVGMAAALLDSLTEDIQLGVPVTVYHRVFTSDGALYTASPTVQATFIRSAITSHEPDGDLPERFALRGNHPNPFNPSTTLVGSNPTRGANSANTRGLEYLKSCILRLRPVRQIESALLEFSEDRLPNAGIGP